MSFNKKNDTSSLRKIRAVSRILWKEEGSLEIMQMEIIT